MAGEGLETPQRGLESAHCTRVHATSRRRSADEMGPGNSGPRVSDHTYNSTSLRAAQRMAGGADWSVDDPRSRLRVA